MPRGHLKSSVVTIGSTLQYIVKDPNKRTLIVNATGKNARAFLRSIQAQMTQNENFIKLYGENEYGVIGQDPETWTQWEITVPRWSIFTEPTIRVSGLSSTNVSQHYDRIILDDLVNRENVSTSEQIEKIIQYYRDYEDLLEPDGQMIVIGTRWHWGDLYGWLLENAPDLFKEPLIMKACKDGDLENGKILFPQKFTREKLKQLYTIKGPYDFSAQYFNDPTHEADSVFQKRWFRYYRFTPDKVELVDTNDKVRETIDRKIMNTYLSVDPAITERRDGDFSGLVVVSIDPDNNWFIRETVKLKLRPSELILKVFQLADKYKVKAIGVESVAFQKSLVYDFTTQAEKLNKSYKIEEIKPDTTVTKQMRIAGLQPRYARGKVFHPLSIMGGDLETELLHHPRPVHDDLSDALQQINQFAKVPFDGVYEDIQPAGISYASARTNPYTGY